MSLQPCEIVREGGEYKDFKFMVKALYQTISRMIGLKREAIGGVVYVQDKQKRIEEVELFIDSSGRIKDIDKLRLAGAKRGLNISDLNGLVDEILRKYRLIKILKNPQDYSYYFQTPLSLRKLLEEFPELTQRGYIEKLPQYFQNRIRSILEIRELKSKIVETKLNG